jgi:hypothetical protein
MEKVIAILAAIAILVWMYFSLKNNPQAFTKENLTKSFGTMGFLALGLIAFIAFCIFLLRST